MRLLGRSRLAGALLVTTALLDSTVATAAPPLRVALSGDNLPLHGRKNGRFVGFEVDLVNEIGKRLKRKVQLVDLSGLDVSSFEAITSGQVDISVNSVTDADAPPDGVVLSTPYLVLPYLLAAKKGTLLEDPKTFTGKVAVLDPAARDVVRRRLPKATAIPKRDRQAAVVDLMRGKVDLLAMESAGLSATTKDTALVVVGPELEEARLVIAGTAEQVEAVNGALTKLEPKIKQLRRKWMPDAGAAVAEIAAIAKTLPERWVELGKHRGKTVIPARCELVTDQIRLFERDGRWFLEVTTGQDSVDGKIEDLQVVGKNSYRITYTGQTVELRFRTGSKTGEWGKSSEFWDGKWKRFVDATHEADFDRILVEKCAE